MSMLCRSGAYKCEPEEKGHWGCTFDRNQRGVCNVKQYQQELPDWNRYFAGQATWGGDQLADFCPLYRYSSNLVSDCRVPEYQLDNIDIRGEVFTPSSRCLDSTLLHESKAGLVGSGGWYVFVFLLFFFFFSIFISFSYPLRCVDGKLFVRVVYDFHDCVRLLNIVFS